MTPETCAALIDVTPNFCVSAVHRRLGVCVAIDTFEGRIRRLGGVTISTCIPPAGTVRVARGDRKIWMGEEDCRNPSQRAMTHGAVCGETRGDVTWISCVKILRPMARDTYDGRAAESIAGMARVTRNRLMCTPGRELRAIVVKA